MKIFSLPEPFSAPLRSGEKNDTLKPDSLNATAL